MTDYRDNAQQRVALAITTPDPTNALIIAQIATAEAVLALVEQQRIANLIALGVVQSGFSGSPTLAARQHLVAYHSEVADALGIEVA